MISGQIMVVEILILLTNNCMRNLFIILLLLFGYACHTQTIVYLKPLTQQKVFITNNRNFLINSSNISNNPYFDFNIDNLSSRISDYVPFGLSFGIKNRERGVIIEIGYVQDGVGCSIELAELVLAPPYPDQLYTPVYLDQTRRGQTLNYSHRVFLDFSQQLFTNSNLKNDFFLHYTTSIMFGETFLKYIFNEYDSYEYLNGGKLKGYGETVIYNGKPSFMLGAGLTTDYYLGFKGNKTYLFSFGVFYNHGFKVISSYDLSFLIEDNGNLFHLNYGAQSRGSGIYFELSRRFQLYPWKKRSKT